MKHAYTNDTADPLSLAGTCWADMAVTHGMAAADARPIKPRAASKTSRDHCRLLLTAAAAVEVLLLMQGSAVIAVAADHNSRPSTSTLQGSNSRKVQLRSGRLDTDNRDQCSTPFEVSLA